MMTKTAKEIRSDAWVALGENGQYLRYVAAYLLLMFMLVLAVVPLMGILGAGIGMSGIGPFLAPGGCPEIGLLADPGVMVPLVVALIVFSLLIIYPIGFGAWGQAAMAIAAMRRGLNVGHAFSGWGHGWRMGWIVTVKFTYLSLWALLLYVPMFVKLCAYSMTEFIAVDHPEWTASQCITESRRLMDGHKWRYFCLKLSFIGWIMLVAAASMVPMIGNLAQWFFMPYFESASAAFYEDLLDRDSPPSADTEPVTDYVNLIERGGVV